MTKPRCLLQAMRGVFPAHRPSLAGRRTSLSFGRVAGAPAGPTNSLYDVDQISDWALPSNGGNAVPAAAPLPGGAIRTVRRSHAPILLGCSIVFVAAPRTRVSRMSAAGPRSRRQGNSAPFRRRRQTLFGVSTENVIGHLRQPPGPAFWGGVSVSSCHGASGDRFLLCSFPLPLTRKSR